MSNACAWPSRPVIGWPREPGCDCPRRRESPSLRWPSSTACDSSPTDDLCAEDDLDPDIVFEATEIPTMEGLVAAGFGVAVVPVPREGGG